MSGRQTKKLPMTKLYPIMLDEFSHGREFRMITNGTSMMPLIGSGCDTVVLRQVNGPLKKNDIPLYRRADGSFVLHRIVGTRGNEYIMCGDNQTELEYGISDANIVAIASGVIKNGVMYNFKGARYRLYCARIGLRRRRKRLTLKIKRLIKSVICK